MNDVKYILICLFFTLLISVSCSGLTGDDTIGEIDLSRKPKDTNFPPVSDQNNLEINQYFLGSSTASNMSLHFQAEKWICEKKDSLESNPVVGFPVDFDFKEYNKMYYLLPVLSEMSWTGSTDEQDQVKIFYSSPPIGYEEDPTMIEENEKKSHYSKWESISEMELLSFNSSIQTNTVLKVNPLQNFEKNDYIGHPTFALFPHSGNAMAFYHAFSHLKNFIVKRSEKEETFTSPFITGFIQIRPFELYKSGHRDLSNKVIFSVKIVVNGDIEIPDSWNGGEILNYSHSEIIKLGGNRATEEPEEFHGYSFPFKIEITLSDLRMDLEDFLNQCVSSVSLDNPLAFS